jgi:hypothetical protein
MNTEDLLLEFMAKVNDAVKLGDERARLPAVKSAKHWAEVEYAKLVGCTAGLVEVAEQ